MASGLTATAATPAYAATAGTVVQAHNWAAKSGNICLETDKSSDNNSIGCANPGSWTRYDNIDFGAGGFDTFMVTLASTASGNHVEVRLDSATGTKVADVTVASTGSWSVFGEQYSAVSAVTGVHAVYLVFPQGNVNVNWFVFNKNPDSETTAQRTARMAWWNQARFGQFIHFGSYSYLAHDEWAYQREGWNKADYKRLVTAPFNPTAYNATSIANNAKNAGQQYIVITAKHHEGFSMWPTQIDDFAPYSINNYTAFQRDPIMELKNASDAAGIKFGLYYSIMDWIHPSQNISSINGTTFTTMTAGMKTKYIEEMKEQLRELVQTYKPTVMWFDGDWNPGVIPSTDQDWWNANDGRALYKYLRMLDPNLIINDRVKRDAVLGDYTTPEQTIPEGNVPTRDWETCQTMNNSWGYRESDTSMKSTTTLVRQLVQTTSLGGNYLLNIGPKGDGSTPATTVTALQGIGSWMSTYKDSVVGSNKSIYSAVPSWGRYTARDGRLFAHVNTWPTNGVLQVPTVTNTISRIYSMANPTVNLAYTVSGGNINITVPGTAPNAIDSVIAIEMSGYPTAGTSGSTAIVSGSTYKLINQFNNKALDNNSSVTNGTPVVQWMDNGGSQKNWRVTDVGSGYYKLVSRHSGKALDNNSTTGGGLPVVQWTDNGGDPQKWQLVDVGGGYYSVINKRSGLALDSNNQTIDGDGMVQKAYTGASSQKWRLVLVP